MEKNVFRYLSDAKDWALAMVDVPVSDGDVLYSDSQGRSELTFPNDTKIRLNDKTKIQLDRVKGNSTSLFVNSGIARVQNGSADNVVKVDTPYGQVLSKQPGAFDVYVGDSSVAVTAFKAPLQFVDGKGTQYDVKPEADSLLANEKAVVATPRFLNSRWDSWNNERDKELQVWEVNPSPYLPEQLKSDSKTLADNGAWEELSHGGETAHYWTPRNVAPDWSPHRGSMDKLEWRTIVGALRTFRLGNPSSWRLDSSQQALVLAPSATGKMAPRTLVPGAGSLGSQRAPYRLGSDIALRSLLRPALLGAPVRGLP